MVALGGHIGPPLHVHYLFFFFHIALLSLRKFLKIDQMAVKVRAINTTKSCNIANSHTAGAAHSCGIDHYRVQADNRFYSIWLAADFISFSKITSSFFLAPTIPIIWFPASLRAFVTG